MQSHPVPQEDFMFFKFSLQLYSFTIILIRNSLNFLILFWALWSEDLCIFASGNYFLLFTGYFVLIDSLFSLCRTSISHDLKLWDKFFFWCFPSCFFSVFCSPFLQICLHLSLMKFSWEEIGRWIWHVGLGWLPTVEIIRKEKNQEEPSYY